MTISALMDWFKNKGNISDCLLFYAFLCVLFSMPLGTSPPTIFGGLAILIWFFSGKALKVKQICMAQSWFWPVLLLIALPWLGLLYAPDPVGIGIKFAKKTHYWIYCFAIASISFKHFSTQRLIQAFLLGLAINSFVGILQFIGIFPPVQNSLKGQYCGFGLQYSTLSAYLVVGILSASYYFKQANDKKLQIFFLSLIVLYFFNITILNGRAGYLSFFLLFPFIINNVFKKVNFFKMLLACVIVLGLMLLSPIVRDRVSVSIDQVKYHLNADPQKAWGKEYSVHQDRFSMWYGAIRIFCEHPIFGVGTGGYQTFIKKTMGPNWPIISHPHNNILYMAVSFGVIGIFVFLWFFWEIIKNSWRKRDTALGFFVMSIALVIFTTGFVNTQIHDAGTLFLLTIGTGLQKEL